MQSFNECCRYLNKQTCAILLRVADEIKKRTIEIVLRCESALYIVCSDGTYFVDSSGNCSRTCTSKAYCVSFVEVREAVLRACGFAVYAHKDELLNGYIGLGNGSRMALVGSLGNLHNVPAELSSISAVRLRIGRHIKMNTDFIFHSDKLCSVLVTGPPASGKTTLLRNIALNLTDGTYEQYYRVSVVDERNELFPDGLLHSPCVDVLSGVKKEKGIQAALRLCSPQVIICDEIGSSEEAQSILDCLNSGVKFICSIHAGNKEELYRRPCYKQLMERSVFEQFVFLHSNPPGTIARIYDTMEMIS